MLRLFLWRYKTELPADCMHQSYFCGILIAAIKQPLAADYIYITVRAPVALKHTYICMTRGCAQLISNQRCPAKTRQTIWPFIVYNRSARVLLFSNRNRAQIVQLNHLFGVAAQLSHIHRTARSCSLSNWNSPVDRGTLFCCSLFDSVVYLPYPLAVDRCSV